MRFVSQLTHFPVGAHSQSETPAGQQADTMGDGKGALGIRVAGSTPLLSLPQRVVPGRAGTYLGTSPCEELGWSLSPCRSLLGERSHGGLRGDMGVNPQCWLVFGFSRGSLPPNGPWQKNAQSGKVMSRRTSLRARRAAAGTRPGARLVSALCSGGRAITAPPCPLGSGTSQGQREGCSAARAASANSNRLPPAIEPGPCLQPHLELEDSRACPGHKRVLQKPGEL